VVKRPLRLSARVSLALLRAGWLQLGRRAPGGGLHGLASMMAKQPVALLVAGTMLLALAALELLRRQRRVG
jgi:hypothetical protein